MVEMAQGKVPFHEKNLSEVIRRNVRSGRLAYSTDVESFARKSGVIFLAEDTSEQLAELTVRIARAVTKPPILSIVTPVSVGTGTILEKKLHDAGLKATIVSQPMFFTAGCAVEDFNWPDRIVLGTSSNDAVLAIKQIFHPLVMRGVPVIVTNHETAELVRESATAFVAAKISFINELAGLCERVNGDAVHLSLALGPTLLAGGSRDGRTICPVGYGFAGESGAAEQRRSEDSDRSPRSEHVAGGWFGREDFGVLAFAAK
jgi:UDPglucose 6-dehydrogenase